MKIILPADEIKDNLCIVFARAPYFAIYDTDTNKIEYLDNPAAKVQGGAGIKAAQFVADSQADVLITLRLGENSAEILNEIGMKIYKSSYEGVKANINAFINNELELLTQFHGGFHGHL